MTPGVHSVADYSDKELEQELTRRKLDKEQQLADEPTKCVNVVTGAVGLPLLTQGHSQPLFLVHFSTRCWHI